MIYRKVTLISMLQTSCSRVHKLRYTAQCKHSVFITGLEIGVVKIGSQCLKAKYEAICSLEGALVHSTKV
jgi:hypothetical protein